MKRRVAWLAVLLLAGLVWWLWPDSTEVVAAPPKPEASPPVVEVGGLTVLRDSDFDRHYGAPDGTVTADLEAVAAIWEAALLLVKDFDRYPLPDNAAITAFLQGKNPHRVAWIRPGHPSVGADGELLDRWGSPLFFHRESARKTGYRSAGPDRVMWTGDDAEWPAPER